MVTLFVTLMPFFAQAQSFIATGDGIQFQSSFTLNKGESPRRFCDGKEVPYTPQTQSGTCCDLELRTSWNIPVTVSDGPRQIRWAAPLSGRTYLDLEVLPAESNASELDGHALHIRCDAIAPTWENLSRAFGSLIAKTKVRRTRLDVLSEPGYRSNFSVQENSPVPEILTNQRAVFNDESVAIVTHANVFWDRLAKTEPGIKNLLAFSRQNGIPSFALLSSQTDQRYLFDKKDITHLVQSEAGQLRVQFPKARNIILGGGALRQCLCESLRDSVRGAVREGATVNVFVLLDSIYDGAGADWPMQTLTNASGYITQSRYAWPVATWDMAGQLLRPGEWVQAGPSARSAGDFGHYLLKDLYDLDLDRHTFFGQFEKYVLNKRFNSLCDRQNGYNAPELDPRLMSYEIYDGTDRLVLAAKNLNPHLSVRFIVTDTQNLDRVFEFWKQKTGPS